MAASGTSTELIGGLDEVGYGSWAGPVISVVAVFDEEHLRRLPAAVTDSKKTTEKKRSMLFLPIITSTVDIGIGYAWPWEIDAYGASNSLQMSYRRALEDLSALPSTLIVDGVNRVTAFRGKQIVEPKADLNHPEVSAASMVAKHFRDTMMVDYAAKFPGYGWEKNKGYGSHAHEEGIKKLGLLVDLNDKQRYLHRRYYCRKVLLRTS
jgi:ribonuclease HII